MPAEDIRNLERGVCQQYTGCPAAVMERYPLVFCTTQGFGRTDMASMAVPLITRFFEAAEPE